MINIEDGSAIVSAQQPMGGTELMYEGLKARIDPDLFARFHIICSRLPKILPEDKPIILWLHDTWNDPEAAHLRDAESRRRFEKLVFVSHYQQQTFTAGLGVPYSDGVVLQNAIVPIPHHEKPTDRINIIYHTTPHRGLELLVPVFNEIVKHFPDEAIHLDVYSSFAMYGWQERDVPYEALFKVCREHPHITYHGFQSNEIIRAALKNAHIFAYPSIWPETSCIAAIEALDAGCEVICPNYAALPETTANFASLYQMDENPTRHANRFGEVLYNTLATYQHGPNQRRMFQKTYFDSVYDWNTRAKQWTALLTHLINNPSV